LKKLAKKRQNDAAAAEKAAAKAAKEAATGGGEKKAKAGAVEELDPTKYTENRKNFIQAQRNEGKNPYPHKFNRDMTVPQFREKYE